MNTTINPEMNTGKPINLTKARELLAAAVETQGRDFIYQDWGVRGSHCYNLPAGELTRGQDHQIKDNSPKRLTGCLVGTAMKLAGVCDMSLHQAGSVWTFDGYLETDAREYFQIAQAAQDTGATWGQAFDFAESYVPVDLETDAGVKLAQRVDWWSGSVQQACKPAPEVPATEVELANASA